MHSIDFIMKVFREIERKKITYGIFRKSEDIEKGIAHDIDMALDSCYIKETMELLDIIAAEMGWIKILCTDKDCGNLKTIHYAYTREAKPEIVHFDLFKCFSWNGVILFSNAELLMNLYKKGSFYCISEEMEIAIKLISRLIYQGYIKEEYKADIQQYSNDNPDRLEMVIQKCFGSELTKIILNSCKNGDWQAIENRKKQIREACLSNFKRTSKMNRYVFKIKRALNPKGVMVSFLGTDGSGKSTIIEGLPEFIGNSFDKSQIKYFHWRPGFLKSPKGEKSGSRANTSEPHQQKPYSKSVSFLKFMYFNLDYILGYWISVRKHLIKNNLVIFDRYYYDYFLDKYRYRFDISDRVLKAFRIIIPKPDITFLLVGDAEILFERKKELSVDELGKQMARMTASQSIIPNYAVIDVNQPIKEVLNEVSRELLIFMSRR